MKYFASFLPLLALASASSIVKRHTGVRIQSARNGHCLSPKAPDQLNSTIVAIDCDRAQVWDINPGSGNIVLSGTNKALSTGPEPKLNGKLKLEQTSSEAIGQTWNFVDEHRIKLEKFTDSEQCLDQGNSTEGTQIYKCYEDNVNQGWRVLPADAGNETSTVDTNVTLSVDETYKWLEVFAYNKSQYEGSNLALSHSLAEPSESGFDTQRWNVIQGGTGPIKLTSDESLCIDAGQNPTDGVQVKVERCADNGSSQTWDNSKPRLQLSGTNWCITGKFNDVTDEVTGKTSIGPAKAVLNECKEEGNNIHQAFYAGIQ
ncbi:hypothetical protein IAT40_001796 [Kwoniella sp. CBS 6097]